MLCHLPITSNHLPVTFVFSLSRCLSLSLSLHLSPSLSLSLAASPSLPVSLSHTHEGCDLAAPAIENGDLGWGRGREEGSGSWGRSGVRRYSAHGAAEREDDWDERHPAFHPLTLSPPHPHTLTPSHPHTLAPSHPHTRTLTP